MKKNISISVGIPVFNEEKTIYFLIQSLLQQKHVVLKEILIADDGSTDNSLQEIKRVKDKKIHVIRGGKRMGKSVRLQQILKKFSGDVLILIDGDVYISDSTLLKKIITQYLKKHVDLVGVHPYPLKPTTLFQRVLLASIIFQDYIKPLWENGDNYLSFKGNLLLLSKTFAKSFPLPKRLVNDDAYFYFYAKMNRFPRMYIPSDTIYYTLPKTYADHKKQAARFSTSKNELYRYFPNSVLEYAIPTVIYTNAFIKTLLKEHIFFISYLFLWLYTKLSLREETDARWQMAGTTKGGMYV